MISVKNLLSKTIIPFILIGVLLMVTYLAKYEFIAFSFIGLVVSLLCFLLALIIFSYSRRRVHIIWGFFNVSVSIWGAGCLFIGISGNRYSEAVLSWKLFVLGITFIPVFCYHFVHEICALKSRKFLFFCYFQAIIFSTINLVSDLLVNDLSFLFDEIYYLKANMLYSVYFVIWSCIVFVSFFNLYKHYRNTSGSEKIQSSYLFYGMLVGFLGGGATALPAWNINVYPFGHFLTCFYAAICTYAIFKYQLIDIKIAITRISVFVLVYSIVLGIPFALAFGLQERLINLFGQNWWIIPLISLTVLATAGPFIYLYIQRKAEDKLLKEQRQYQVTLRQASMGMGQIKDLKRLLQLIVHIVTRAVSVEHCKIFLMHEESTQFILKASRGKQLGHNEVSVLALDSSLIDYLKRIKEPVVYEEIKQRMDDYKEKELKGIEVDINRVDGALIVPSFIDQKLIAILVLGKKKSGKLYTQDDLVVFSILANQAGLAIENAQFYERMKETHMQLVKAEKMATVGTMADGLSHQINNRLHAMGFIAGDALDTIRLKKKKKLTKDMKAFLDEIEYSFDRIEDNVKRGGEIVEGLLKYTRRDAEGFETIDLNKLLDAALEMACFKIKLNEMNFIRNFDGNIPRIRGNFTQLQEVFFNVIDNAYDAMMQRKTELKEPGYKANLEFSANQKDHKLEILIKDNGIGVKKENLKKLFTPFFTTKLSSKKGTGLGLYVIRQIIEENHGGKVRFISEYQKGSQTSILLPVAVEG